MNIINKILAEGMKMKLLAPFKFHKETMDFITKKKWSAIIVYPVIIIMWYGYYMWKDEIVMSKKDKKFLLEKDNISDQIVLAINYKLTKDKSNRNIYEIEVQCPFCSEVITYKNCNIKNRFFYRTGLKCRECHYRFYIISKLRRLYDSFPLLIVLRKFQVKIRNKIFGENY